MSVIDDLTAILPVRWEEVRDDGCTWWWWEFSSVLVALAQNDGCRFNCVLSVAVTTNPEGTSVHSAFAASPIALLQDLLLVHPWIRELAMRDRILGVVKGARVEACVAGPFIDAAWMDGRISWRLKRSLQHDTQPFYEPWKAQAGSIEYWESETRYGERYFLNRNGPRPDAGTLAEEVWA